MRLKGSGQMLMVASTQWFFNSLLQSSLLFLDFSDTIKNVQQFERPIRHRVPGKRIVSGHVPCLFQKLYNLRGIFLGGFGLDVADNFLMLRQFGGLGNAGEPLNLARARAFLSRPFTSCAMQVFSHALLSPPCNQPLYFAPSAVPPCRLLISTVRWPSRCCPSKLENDIETQASLLFRLANTLGYH